MADINYEEINKKFQRNALGRLVTNSEKVQNLPITTEESIHHLPMDEQIKLLTRRLEEIGGSKYRAAEFEFDEGPSWPGFTKGETWNGWACPYFTKEVAMSILDWMGENNNEEYSLTYEVEEKMITIIETGYETEPYTIEENEDGFYNLGGSWTWSEKSYSCALCCASYEPTDSGAVGEFCSQTCKDEAEENVREQEEYNRTHPNMKRVALDELWSYCFTHARNKAVPVDIWATSTIEDIEVQAFKFHISSAQEMNCLLKLMSVMAEFGYDAITYSIPESTPQES